MMEKKKEKKVKKEVKHRSGRAKKPDLSKREIPKNDEEAKSRFPWVGHYTQEMPARLLKHLSDGYSFSSFGGVVKVARSTINEWVEIYEEFRIAKDIGESAGLGFWERMNIANSMGQKILNKEGKVVFDPKTSDPKSINFVLRTRFHKEYSTKINVNNETPVTSLVFVEYGAEENE